MVPQKNVRLAKFNVKPVKLQKQTAKHAKEETGRQFQAVNVLMDFISPIP
jgi:hypothetical protein